MRRGNRLERHNAEFACKLPSAIDRLLRFFQNIIRLPILKSGSVRRGIP